MDFPSRGWSAGFADARYARARALLSHVVTGWEVDRIRFFRPRADLYLEKLRWAHGANRSRCMKDHISVRMAWSPRGDWIVCATPNGWIA